LLKATFLQPVRIARYLNERRRLRAASDFFFRRTLGFS